MRFEYFNLRLSYGCYFSIEKTEYFGDNLI